MLHIKDYIKKCGAIIFPQLCVLCDMPYAGDIAFCHICQEDLPWITHGCQKCGAALSECASASICGECLHTPIATGIAVIPFHYQSPIDFLITQLKFNENLRVASVFAQLLQPYLQKAYADTLSWPEVIIPMPLHLKRLSERGFNQALEIAKTLVRNISVPIDVALCQRQKYTEAQANLTAKLRKANVHNAFSAAKNTGYRHVVILDDVITTGHTVRALVKTLNKAGVERIDVWAVARA